MTNNYNTFSLYEITKHSNKIETTNINLKKRQDSDDYTLQNLSSKLLIGGDFTPLSKVHLHDNDINKIIDIRFTDNDTGIDSTDGCVIRKNAVHNLELWNYENSDIIFGTNNSQRIKILGNGNIGIGVSTPNTIFEIRKSQSNGINNYSHLFLSNSSIIDSVGHTGICFSTATENNYNYWASISGARLGTNSEPSLQFHTANNSTNGTTHMTIKNSGFIGIGKTDPEYTLDVSGDINCSGSFKINGINLELELSQWITSTTPHEYISYGNVKVYNDNIIIKDKKVATVNDLNTVLELKQNSLIEGYGIQINDSNEISCTIVNTDTTYTAGFGIHINDSNEISSTIISTQWSNINTNDIKYELVSIKKQSSIFTYLPLLGGNRVTSQDYKEYIITYDDSSFFKTKISSIFYLNGTYGISKLYDEEINSWGFIGGDYYVPLTGIAKRTLFTDYDGEWIMVDIGYQSVLNKIQIVPPGSVNNPVRQMKTFRIYASNDTNVYDNIDSDDNITNTNLWTLIQDESNDDNTTSQKTFNISSNSSFRYYLIIVNEVFPQQNYGIFALAKLSFGFSNGLFNELINIDENIKIYSNRITIDNINVATTNDLDTTSNNLATFIMEVDDILKKENEILKKENEILKQEIYNIKSYLNI